MDTPIPGTLQGLPVTITPTEIPHVPQSADSPPDPNPELAYLAQIEWPSGRRETVSFVCLRSDLDPYFTPDAPAGS